MKNSKEKSDSNKMLLGRLLRIQGFVAKNGMPYALYLVYIYSLLPLVAAVMPFFAKIFSKIDTIIEKHLLIGRDLAYWRKNKGKLISESQGREAYRIRIEDLGFNEKALGSLKEEQKRSREVVIGKVGEGEYILSRFGMIKNLPTVPVERFIERKEKRYSLEIVAIDGYVGMKKYFKKNKLMFARSIKAADRLSLAGCNVPTILDIDFDALSLTLAYIKGRDIRDLFRQESAGPDNLVAGEGTIEINRRVYNKEKFNNVLSQRFVENLFGEIKKIYAEGFIYCDMSYGNIVVEEKTGNPYFVDLDNVRDYSKMGKIFFRTLCDKYTAIFNRRFFAEELTRSEVEYKIRELKKSEHFKLYAPVYFGHGLAFGNIWQMDVGQGRWHYLLEPNLPSPRGRRILDLGANNGFNSMQLLRNGASEAVALERNSVFIKQGELFKSVFEWADNVQRYNFRYIQADMKDLPSIDIGKFDMVMALCCLYYLEEDSILSVVRHIRAITDTFILQCNVTTFRNDHAMHKKASLEYTMEILKKCGFVVTKVVEPQGYSRPLVIAK